MSADEAMALAQERPWRVEQEAEEAARKAAEQAKRDEVERARGDVDKLGRTPTVEELAAAVAALQKQVDWLMEQLNMISPPEAANVRSADEIKTRPQVFADYITAADLEKKLDEEPRWEKWHAEVKASKLFVVLVRRVPVEPMPEPEKKAEAEPDKPAATIKTVGPTLIIPQTTIKEIVEREIEARFGESEHQHALGKLLHPRADGRSECGEPDEPEITMGEGAADALNPRAGQI